jgi:KUP system potassium uptake protein
MLYPLVGLATLATVIASQAVISGAFSVSRQAMQLGFLPRFEVQYTSEKAAGAGLSAGRQLGPFLRRGDPRARLPSSSKSPRAYGIAVTGDMVITSCLATSSPPKAGAGAGRARWRCLPCSWWSS